MATKYLEKTEEGVPVVPKIEAKEGPPRRVADRWLSRRTWRPQPRLSPFLVQET